MNPMPRAIAGDWLRRPLPLLGFIALFAATVYKAANYVIAGDMTSLAYVALLFIGSAFVVAMLNSWQKGLYFFLTWLLFEDFARKYLGNNMAIYFAKDVLALVVYLAFFLAYRRKQVTSFRPPFRQGRPSSRCLSRFFSGVSAKTSHVFPAPVSLAGPFVRLVWSDAGL